MCGLPVDRDIQAAIISPLGVKKGKASIVFHFHSELDGWYHTVEVTQESFHCGSSGGRRSQVVGYQMA